MAKYSIPYQNIEVDVPDEGQVFRGGGPAGTNTADSAYVRYGDTLYQIPKAQFTGNFDSLEEINPGSEGLNYLTKGGKKTVFGNVEPFQRALQGTPTPGEVITRSINPLNPQGTVVSSSTVGELSRSTSMEQQAAKFNVTPETLKASQTTQTPTGTFEAGKFTPGAQAPTPQPLPGQAPQGAPGASAVSITPGSVSTHTVKEGDTLSEIAQRYGVPISQITGYRSGNPNLIFPGEVLNINKQPVVSAPGGAPTTTPEAPGGPVAPPAPQTGITAPGGSFDDLFAQYGLSTKNNIEDIIKSISKLYGFDDINKEMETLDNEKIDELKSVSDNPWLSESLRSRESASIETKYEQKRDALVNRLRVQGDTMGRAIDIYYKEKSFQQETLSRMLNFRDAELDRQSKQSQQDFQNRIALEQLELDRLSTQSLINKRETISGSGGEVGGKGLASTLDTTSPTYLFDLMDSTVGRKAPNQIETLRPIQKSIAVINQLSDLQKSISNTVTDPILGLMRQYNPYDFDVRAIQSQLQAVVPNLARGVYGEVGVLTDQDIKNYIQTLPNIRGTEEQNKFVMGMTLRTVQRNLESQLETLASAGYDISGFKNQYQKVLNTTQQIEKELGVGSGKNISESDLRLEYDIFSGTQTTTESSFFGDLKSFLFGQ